MEETIDLRECFGIIKKRFWIIALITTIAIVVSGIISFFVLKPVYQAKSTLIVNTEKTQENQVITGDQFSVTQKLAVTYGEIIKSRTVLEDVIKNLNLKTSYEGLAGQVTVSPVKDTQIISISIEDNNKQKARDIANEIPKVFTEEAKRITKANDVQVIDEAILPKAPVKPNKIMNMAISAVLGMMIGLFVVFLIEYLDNKLKTPQDIEKNLGLAVIGVISMENMSTVLDKIISIKNPKSPISESYRGIRTSIEFSNIDQKMKVITITSSMKNEGKSTIISNLAVNFANLEKKVLLLEGDLRNPSIHRMFNISNANGLTDILLSNKGFAECVHCTDVKNLHILTCGTIPPNPSEMLSSNKMKEFISELKEHYDYIFIDAPPIGVVTDAEIISNYSDGCVFVVGSKQCNVEMAKLAKQRLEGVRANIIGAVLNKFEYEGSNYSYYNYYYKEDSERKCKNKRNKKRKK